ncbi:hypothetical protein E2C01_066195 [Portunus trituberculatus]|uniref:Uncharacterized protein n=1 Tax=Portunus trituberculatus TaxID=210409 RepID=A0A5B7HP42_PORTR|nr:hypothetical protein [Portunus trituberculatus]
MGVKKNRSGLLLFLLLLFLLHVFFLPSPPSSPGGWSELVRRDVASGIMLRTLPMMYDARLHSITPTFPPRPRTRFVSGMPESLKNSLPLSYFHLLGINIETYLTPPYLYLPSTPLPSLAPNAMSALNSPTFIQLLLTYIPRNIGSRPAINIYRKPHSPVTSVVTNSSAGLVGQNWLIGRAPTTPTRHDIHAKVRF